PWRRTDMPRSLTWMDRLRIWRAVWTVDILTSDLPHRQQRALVRELRANVRSAAAEVGAAEAVRQLGSPRALARGYLEAQFGETGPRPSIFRGLVWLTVVDILFLTAFIGSFNGFLAGVKAADAHASGTYAYHTYAYHVLMVSQDATFVNGEVS